jgi:hypothetical protein
MPDNEFGIGAAVVAELATTAPIGALVQRVKLTLKLGAIGCREMAIAAVMMSKIPVTIAPVRMFFRILCLIPKALGTNRSTVNKYIAVFQVSSNLLLTMFYWGFVRI